MLCLACGGGSRGTGGVSVEGQVSRTDNQMPLENAEIRLLGVEEATRTDGNGLFVFEEPVHTDSLSRQPLVVLITFAASSIEITLTPIGAEVNAVFIALEVDVVTQSGTGEIIDVSMDSAENGSSSMDSAPQEDAGEPTQTAPLSEHGESDDMTPMEISEDDDSEEDIDQEDQSVDDNSGDDDSSDDDDDSSDDDSTID